jgi:hypothetical protein
MAYDPIVLDSREFPDFYRMEKEGILKASKQMVGVSKCCGGCSSTQCGSGCNSGSIKFFKIKGQNPLSAKFHKINR